jgi:lysine N6-hydroxylase
MTAVTTHDLVGIGLGPFNLGLACLADPVPDLDAVFLESRPEFRWHPGMLIEGATIQVPFLADLVTMADPTSPYSFLAWLKETGRMHRFYIRESFYPLRAEFDAYCRWAAGRVSGIRFGHHVTRVEHVVDAESPGGAYAVHVRREDGSATVVRGRHLAVGVGTEPSVPEALSGLDGPVVHSADYTASREWLRGRPSVTVVGSGQSAAEIYRDLLEGVHDGGPRVDWVTRSPRFFPMEYTKLTLEMTSPEYISYFHSLPPARRDSLLREQRSLYKGISGDLVNDIFDTLYRLDLDDHGQQRGVPSDLLTCTEVTDAEWSSSTDRFRIRLRQWETGDTWTHETGALVLATGYRPRVPAFLDGIADRIRRDESGRLDVARGYTVDHADRDVFVQNAEEHTHGLSAPDLGMGAYRNSVILAQVVGREVYPVERRIAFQQFGMPSSAAPTTGDVPRVSARETAEVVA